MFYKCLLFALLLGPFKLIMGEGTNFIHINSAAALNGDYELKFEKPLTNSWSLNTGLRYKDGQLGLSYVIYPVNIERMFDATVMAGMRWYPFKTLSGYYGSMDLEGGYSCTEVKHVYSNALDSTKADGILIAPRATLGYKWIIKKRFTLAPEIGASYEINSTNFKKLSESEEVKDKVFAFTLSKAYLKRYHNGVRPILLVNLGFAF